MNVNKDYLGAENARNKRNASLYERLLKRAIGENVAVLVGHHITFEIGGDLSTENEIPSADCLMFDHDIMTAVFGDRAIPIMHELVHLTCDERDALLAKHFEDLEVAA
jgi:hypothetical protein